MTLLHKSEGTVVAYSDEYSGPELIELEASNGSWEWNKILDEESPFFKSGVDRSSQDNINEQDILGGNRQRKALRESIFLPKFKEFVFWNFETDCSVSK
jgi:hypothetical protein